MDRTVLNASSTVTDISHSLAVSLDTSTGGEINLSPFGLPHSCENALISFSIHKLLVVTCLSSIRDTGF